MTIYALQQKGSATNFKCIWLSPQAFRRNFDICTYPAASGQGWNYVRTRFALFAGSPEPRTGVV